MAERRFAVVVEACPDPAESVEVLELILAAASLELSLTVVLCGDAADLLSAPETRSWQQLIEHDLAEVFVSGETGADRPLPPGAKRLSRAELQVLERTATVIGT